MLSSLKNYTNNLQYSERFQNNNFAYYNDYETKADYEGDLTKMFYNCSRKAPPLFVMNNLNKYKDATSKMRRIVIDEDGTEEYIDTFLNNFYQIYNENNFSDMKDDLQQFKYKHNVRYFPDEIDVQKKNNQKAFQNKEILALGSYTDFKKYMKDEGNKINQILNELDMEIIAPDKALFYQRWFALQNLMLERFQKMEATIIEKQLVQKNSLFSFKWITEEILDQMTSAQVWPVLLLMIPNVPQFKYFINPLTIALQGFMLKEISITKSLSEQRIQTPKLMFINLDGKESPFNIRAIKSIKQSVYYITIFKQPDMSNESEQQIASNRAYSKLLMTQLSFDQKQFNLAQKHTELKQQVNDKYFKILAFPLNSEYLKEQYQRHNNNKPFVEFGTSQDILFLFQHAIYNEIREYVPNTIIVSYNGQLNILQEHFNQIIRNLTIIGDHRVLLFPNLSQAFVYDQEEEAMEQQIQQSDEVLFLKKYMPYNLGQINQQRFFNNLAMFAKITSGAYSLEERNVLPQYSKFNMPKKYEYFEKLHSLRYFRHFEKFVMKFWKSDQLRQLLKKQRDVLLEINQNENEQYTKLLNHAIELIGNNQISQFGNNKLIQQVQKIYNKYGEQDFPKYLEQKKNQLLCQNLYQTKSTKVYYQMNTQEKLEKRIKCCRFKIQKEENYQLRFQKYTQFFFNQKHGFVIVVNHKLKQDKHCHLIGQMSQISTKGEIQLTELAINYKGQGMLEENNPNKILYINYNHCYTSKYLYIFWPEQWNILELIVCRMLEVEYVPKLVHKIWRFEWFIDYKKTKMEQLNFNLFSSSPNLIPRFGCSCYSIKEDIIYIFGGIYSSLDDFKLLPPTISKLYINKNLQTYIKNIEKNMTGARLRAKINYTIQNKRDEKDKKENQKIIILSGGYGRDFTNVYNLFSCHSYQFDITKQELIKIRHPMRTIKLDKPLSTKKAGKFNLIVDDKGQLKFDEKFSNVPKEKFIFEERPANIAQSQVGDIIAFMDENFKISEFKTQHRKMYLFGFSRKLKQNIYTNYWSAEFYIHDGSKSYRIEILLETHKNIEQYKIGSYIFPTEDMIISTAINENKLYILAISPIFTKNLYTLYEGSLNSINDIIEKKKINMTNKYTFSGKYTFNLEEKSMYFEDDTIYITGGRCKQVRIRQDIILQKKRQKYYLRLRRLKTQSKDISLEMLNPYVIKQQKLYSYSLQMDQDSQNWYLKVEATTPNFQQSQITKGQFRLFAIDYTEYKRTRIVPDLIQPRFIKILKYQQFNFEAFTSIIERLAQAISSKIVSLNQQYKELIKIERDQKLKPWKNAQTLCKQRKQSLKKKTNQFNYEFKSLEQLYNSLNNLYKIIRKQQSTDESDQELILQIQATTNMIQKKEIERSCLQRRQDNKQELYRFIVQDLQNNKLIKYFAIGPLNSVQLDFVRVKFKKQILICSNQKSDETIFFNLFEGMYNEFTILKNKTEFQPFDTDIQEQSIRASAKAEMYNI